MAGDRLHRVLAALPAGGRWVVSVAALCSPNRTLVSAAGRQLLQHAGRIGDLLTPAMHTYPHHQVTIMVPRSGGQLVASGGIPAQAIMAAVDADRAATAHGA